VIFKINNTQLASSEGN